MTSTQPVSTTSSGVQRVLANDELNELLHRDGFVKFRLVDRSAAAQLRAEYGELRGWEGEGFCSDLVLEDTDYRVAAQGKIGAALDTAAEDRFGGYTPFLHSFLVKHPGEGSDLYVHQDWMYIDERTGDSTYAVWVALDDVTGHNGQLRVLRGSHHLPSGLRGTNLISPWLEHRKVIDDRLVAVPVEAGECVVFNNRLVHASFPNHTEQPRLAAAVGMRPAHAPLTYFRRIDDTTAAQFEIDESFFTTTTPQGLMATAPDLQQLGVAEVGATELGAEALAAALDHGAVARVDLLRNGVGRAKARVAETAGRAKSAGRELRHNSQSAAQQTFATTSERAEKTRTRVGGAGTALRAKMPTRTSIKATIDELPSKAAIAVLGANEAVINRFGPDTPAIWEPHQFEWARRIEAGYADVRTEVEALLQGPTEIPHIEDVTGGIPQGNIGPWRSFVLMHQGRWIDWNCERCPLTTELVRSVPGLTMAGFSVLEPGTHITVHRGPNKGALRYQLGVIVPGQPGDCRIRVGDEMIVWADGEGVMFDFTVPHEAWNDSEGIRVLLMLEVATPMPWYLDGPNKLAQHAMGWFPTTRNITNRLRALEPQLTKSPPA
jgi:beta-hydroxylase